MKTIRIMLAAFVAGCGAAITAEAADKAYMADHMRCVEQYDTRVQIDACREEVRVRWGVVTTYQLKDGGLDAR